MAYMNRNEATKAIRQALKARSGKAWRVYGHTGTAYGWFTIASPAARLGPDGYMTPAECRELADLLGLSRSVHFQGESVSPEAREVMVSRALGLFKDEDFESRRAWEVEREEQERRAAAPECAEAPLPSADPVDAAEHSGEPFCACGRRVSECDGSRTGCHKRPAAPALDYADRARNFVRYVIERETQESAPLVVPASFPMRPATA
jgi:hypothetical protein